MDGNKRILGLDYGTKTVGVAVSDSLMITAQEVETIVRKESNKLRRTYARIEQLVEAYNVGEIVIGNPLNMNASQGFRSDDTRAFAENVERRTGCPVVLWDERLTTVQSERILMECGVRREHRKEVIDQIAAAIILQSYLDACENRQG